ncbi:hypothetical protein [Streptomyces sp. NPDC001843]|uniref:hypothetical protein n=1 Tax=Streptomyces sp. NPDC001843 TaxID=3364617 RepID=UPI003695440B
MGSEHADEVLKIYDADGIDESPVGEIPHRPWGFEAWFTHPSRLLGAATAVTSDGHCAVPSDAPSFVIREVLMARRSPGEIRAEQPRRVPAGRRVAIDGLCAATHHEIARFETRHQLPTGHVACAFRSWALALHEWPDQGANHGYGTTGWRDMHARTLLQDVATSMRRRSRREFLTVVASLDDRYVSRTLPDPHAASWDPWWKRRLKD